MMHPARPRPALPALVLALLLLVGAVAAQTTPTAVRTTPTPPPSPPGVPPPPALNPANRPEQLDPAYAQALREAIGDDLQRLVEVSTRMQVETAAEALENARREAAEMMRELEHNDQLNELLGDQPVGPDGKPIDRRSLLMRLVLEEALRRQAPTIAGAAPRTVIVPADVAAAARDAAQNPAAVDPARSDAPTTAPRTRPSGASEAPQSNARAGSGERPTTRPQTASQGPLTTGGTASTDQPGTRALLNVDPGAADLAQSLIAPDEVNPGPGPGLPAATPTPVPGRYRAIRLAPGSLLLLAVIGALLIGGLAWSMRRR